MKKSLLGLAFTIFSIYQLEAQSPIVQEKIDIVSLDSLVRYVRDLSGEDSVIINGVQQKILSRHFLEPGNALAADYLEEKLTAYGYPVRKDVFSTNGVNIIGTKEGVIDSNQFIVIGAHYDSYPSGILAPGADDNASGVAAVLEMARLLQDIDLPFSVIFGFWDEEEIGLVGSRAFAQAFGANDEKLKAYINLDMIAWDGNDDGVVEINTRSVANSGIVADMAVENNEIYGIGLQPKIVNMLSNSSDFASFWNNGFTAIGINEIYYDADNNPYWHTIEDKLDKFNLNFFHSTTKLAFATLMELAMDSNSVVSVKNHVAKNDQILLYPQPFEQEIYLKWLSPQEELKNVLLHDLQGKSIAVNYHPQLQKIEISDQLSAGVYILLLEGENTIYVHKIIRH